MISRTAEYALRTVVMPGSNDGTRLCVMLRRLDEGISQIEAIFESTTIGPPLAEQNPSQPLCEMVAYGTSPTRP